MTGRRAASRRILPYQLLRQSADSFNGRTVGIDKIAVGAAVGPMDTAGRSVGRAQLRKGGGGAGVKRFNSRLFTVHAGKIAALP